MVTLYSRARVRSSRAIAIVGLALMLSHVAVGQPATATKTPPSAAVKTQAASPDSAASDFPPELVNWKAWPENPIFTADGPGHWEVKIRERGWVMREGDAWRLWFTGYDGTREGLKMLGYATSNDGIHWTRWPTNPIYRGHWVEDMCIVRQGDTYYMFAESENDNH